MTFEINRLIIPYRNVSPSIDKNLTTNNSHGERLLTQQVNQPTYGGVSSVILTPQGDDFDWSCLVGWLEDDQIKRVTESFGKT